MCTCHKDIKKWQYLKKCSPKLGLKQRYTLGKPNFLNFVPHLPSKITIQSYGKLTVLTVLTNVHHTFFN